VTAPVALDVPIPDDASYPKPWKRWFALGLLLILYALSLLDRQVLSLMVTDVRRDLHLSDFQIGMLQGLAFSIFYATFGLAFGWATDRFNRRGLIFGGVMVWSAAAAMCGLAKNFSQLAMGRFGVGAGEAALNPAAYSLISDMFPKRRLTLAMSIFGTGAAVGVGISLLAVGFLMHHLPEHGANLPLLGQQPRWRIIFLATGAPGLLLAFLIWLMPEPGRRGRVTVGKAGFRELRTFVGARWRLFFGHFTGFGLLASLGHASAAWFPTYLLRRFDLPMSQVVIILAATVAILSPAGTILAGTIIDRMFAAGRRDIHLRLFMVTAALQLVTIWLALSASTLPMFIVFYSLFIFLACYSGGAAAALQVVTPGEFRGQVASGYLFVFNLLGNGIGPVLVGALTTFVFASDDSLGLALGVTATLLLPLSMLALWSGLGPMRKAVAAAPN
jgi:MFS family permease